MAEFIQTSVENGIAWILLNDPTRRNALNQTLATELNEALDAARYDPAVRVVVLRGAGGYFSAGGDIMGMKRRNDAYARGEDTDGDSYSKMANLNRIILSIRQMEKPVVAWIEGACVGGGMSLAMASDFSIAEENCKMGLAFVNVALAPDMSSSLLLPLRVGPARAADLCMTGRQFTARQAEQWGIITQAVPAEELEATVRKLAEKLAVGPTRAYAEIKAALNRNVYNDIYQVLYNETECAIRLGHSKDHVEAVDAFLGKRKPVFVGK